MIKKHTLKKTAAFLLALGLTLGATGCDFLLTDNQKDLAQTVATVNIVGSMSEDEAYEEYADDVEKLINEGGLSTDIPKRDLIAYFLNVGLQYVQNNGATYKETVTMLMDALVERKILTQYAVAYFLKNGEGLTADKCIEYVNAQIDAAQGKEKTLLQNHREALTMKYFLTNGGLTTADDTKTYNQAVYSFMKSLNESLDSTEANYITAKAKDHDHDDTRTTPTNVNQETTEYLPMKDGALDYGVYTGRNMADACGAYETLTGSTATTRKKAYNAFLSNLQGYGLIKEGEDTANIQELDYYYLELSSALSQALINQYSEDLQEKVNESLTAEYVAAYYQKTLTSQRNTYSTNTETFDTALESVSDDAFVLYGKEGFGFVYNILIPFSASQEQAYSAAKNRGLTQNDLFKARKEILEDVQAKDLRFAWFCSDTEADDHYAYKVTATGEQDYYGATQNSEGYLFFHDNFTQDDKYESLTQYAGKYAFNGEATYDEDASKWSFTPDKLSIDEFIQEMEGYINYVVGEDVAAEDTSWTSTYDTDDYKDENGVLEYKNFVYYTGKVNLGGENSAAEYFNQDSKSYKALSAVNELMFAYSTDTGCLNKYMGYAVSPYQTDFVAEFEYAAQMAVRGGVGTYVVAPSDYGWHVIYCSASYQTDGDVYGGYNHALATGDTKVEGSFSNLFYESLKSTSGTSYATEEQNSVLSKYQSAATYYTSRYQDLLDLDA